MSSGHEKLTKSRAREIISQIFNRIGGLFDALSSEESMKIYHNAYKLKCKTAKV